MEPVKRKFFTGPSLKTLNSVHNIPISSGEKPDFFKVSVTPLVGAHPEDVVVITRVRGFI